MITLLALISCQPLSQASTPIDAPVIPEAEEPEVEEVAEALPVRIPAGRAVVRECFGGGESGRVSRRYAPQPTPAKPSSKFASSAPAPSAAAPSGGAGPSGGGDGGGGVAQGLGGLGTKGKGGGSGISSGYGAGASTTPSVQAAAPPPVAQAAPDPKPPAEAQAPMSAPADALAAAEEAEPARRESAQARTRGEADATTGTLSAPKAEAEKKKDVASLGDADDEAGAAWLDAPAEYEEQTASLDWGAKVYLSNDDSMSLASAQRLLWAVQNRGPVQTSQVRPHEFLNYFGFDTVPVRRGDMFSVNAAAERTDGDTLTVAFAVKGKVPARKPLDLTLVLDRSGSMSAEGRMEYLKRGLHKMEESLRPGDRVDLVLFDDTICTPLEDYVVGRDSPALLADTIDRLQPRGSTDLDKGLREGYRIATARPLDDDRNARMMLISDALLNTGDVNPDTVSEVAKAYEKNDIRLTAIGVGRDFNDKVLDMLTEKGKGAYVYLGSEAVVDRVFGLGFDSLTRTIAHDVRFRLDLPPSLAMERFYGEESSTNAEDVQPIHYYAGTSQLFLQDLKIRDRRLAAREELKLVVEYTDADTGKRLSQTWRGTVGELLDSDPRNLHKGQALIAWTDLILARSMGGSPCGAPFDTWRDRVDALGDDAEIAWLDGLTSPLCGQKPAPPKPVAPGVAYKVKVDSDLPIAEVTLSCGGRSWSDALTSSDTVARFAQAKPGACTLTLQGNVPMRAAVDVPVTGGETRCMVRGGRVSCG